MSKQKRPKSRRYRVWIVGEQASHVIATAAEAARLMYATQKGVAITRVRSTED